MAEKYLEVQDGEIKATETLKSLAWDWGQLSPENLAKIQDITQNLNEKAKTEWYKSRMLSKIWFDSLSEKLAEIYDKKIENAVAWYENKVQWSVDVMLEQLLKESQSQMEWKNVYEVAYNATNSRDKQLKDIMGQM